MKCITVYQPFASLIACGAKKIETRGWHTWYTGPLAIHAAQTETYLFLAQAPGRFRDALLAAGVDADNLPTGAVIATSDLRACVQIVNQSIIDGLALTENEIHFGDWTLDRYAWVLGDVRSLAEPIPAQGAQRIWNWDPPDFTNVSLERMSIDMSDLEELEIKADFFGKEFPDEPASPNPAQLNLSRLPLSGLLSKGMAGILFIAAGSESRDITIERWVALAGSMLIWKMGVMMPVIESVTKLYKREKQIRDLCSLMLATLRLKNNRAIFPEKLNDCTDEWQEQYEYIMEHLPVE